MGPHGETDINKMMISVAQQLALVRRCSENKTKADDRMSLDEKEDNVRFYILQQELQVRFLVFCQ